MTQELRGDIQRYLSGKGAHYFQGIYQRIYDLYQDDQDSAIDLYYDAIARALLNYPNDQIMMRRIHDLFIAVRRRSEPLN